MPDENATVPTPEADAEAAPAPRPEVVPDDAGNDRARLEAEIAELKDRMLRTLAEMENLRRRTARELSDARQYAVSSFARDMLTVGDNLKRAIQTVPPELREGGDQALTALIEGVEVTERGLEQTLAKFGVKPIEAKGQRFDPSFHQAMYEVEDPTTPAGMVAEVVQGGYAIGERVLRPAMVAVTKGGPKSAETKPDNTAAEDSVAAEATGKADA